MEALDQAISEIAMPVISRSVQVALTATRELMLKDLCTETDENVLLKNIEALVSKLVGPFTAISAKEPLKVSFSFALKNCLERCPEIPAAEREALIQKIVAENLDTGCDDIRQRAVDIAVEEARLDEAIITAMEARRLAREASGNIGGGGGGYVDEKYYKYMRMLPPSLQPATAASNKAAASMNNIYRNETP